MSKNNLAIERISRRIQEESRRDAPGTGSDKQHPDTPPPKPDEQKPANQPEKK